MGRLLRTHLCHARLDPADVAGGVAVVIDVVRASTTLATAFQNGARSVWPVADLDGARARRESLRRDDDPDALLAGERDGLAPEGFDLGNSPREFDEARVHGRCLAFTTTNGTAALAACARAERIVVGALANRFAVAHALLEDERDVHLVCAGRGGHPALDDALGAAAVAAALLGEGADVEPDEATLLLEPWWDAVDGGPPRLRELLEQSAAGRHLAQVGLVADLDACAALDALDAVPELRHDGALRLP